MNRVQATWVVALALGMLLATAAGASPAGESPADSPRRAHFHKPRISESTTLPAAAGGRIGSPLPRRIVSLAPVLTETLFALGVGARVVGVTRYCDRPEAASKLPKVGGFIDPQLEAILALKPDLVVTMPSRGVRTTLDRLRAQGVPVLVAFGDTIDEVRDQVSAVAGAVGASEQGRELLIRFNAALDEQKKEPSTAAPRVLVLVGARPLIAAGPGTFADQATRWVGARRALDDDTPAWPSLSLEAIAKVAPDVIVAAGGPDDAAALKRALAGLGSRRPPIIHAGRTLLMRPGPHLDEDVAALARLLASWRPAASPP